MRDLAEEACKNLADDAHEVRPLLVPTAVCKLPTATVVCGRHATGTLRDGAYLVVTTHKASIVRTRDFGNINTDEILPFDQDASSNADGVWVLTRKKFAT